MRRRLGHQVSGTEPAHGDQHPGFVIRLDEGTEQHGIAAVWTTHPGTLGPAHAPNLGQHWAATADVQ